jgi:JmjC domain, hydroxylase
MYIAHSSVEDNQHNGSTKLHIDITDAVNIMVWAPSRQQEHHALWRIFPQAASPAICEYLRARNHGDLSDSEHPIHSQSVYFTEAMLEELEAQYGVRPFTIRQHTGEAVFIPAGCAHQVSSICDIRYVFDHGTRGAHLIPF